MYRDESETAFIDGKMDMIKYADNPDCPGRKKNKLRNSISDQESHHSRSPPRSRHQTPERRNSEKDNKISNNSNNPSNNKPKKDTSIKTEKSGEKKQSEKKSKSNKFDFDFAAFIDDLPVYFSMYDKVKARSSKSQALKHQTTKSSKLKQNTAKGEEKSKSVDHDTDKDSDSSHHSSESDSEAKPVKVKQPRKRKFVIESSSYDEMSSQDVNSQSTKAEKDFQSDSVTDSDFFYYNVTHRQATNKSRRKKTELLDSDSSDSDSNFLTKSH